ncbi:energy-coupled thiamine transporter ThiT [Vallitalea okinawensis]|uniref:energy-coupled thiamine transporter ThiT n=1 Tax=Vallitalea okinawensis TaxID=2078660 RepID=UPI000CFE2BA9|nr:energy-coupled thiamine transporter ThiT [Vallitalea okinawensis]
MNSAVIIAILLTSAVFFVSIRQLIGIQFNARLLTRVGLVSALTMVLYTIKLVPFPQGGGCSLLSILPIMLLAVLFGTEEALLSAIVVAFLKIIVQPPYFIMQLPLDYFGAMMAVAFVPMFGTKSKVKLGLGAGLAVTLSTCFSILSGIIFFGEFAPEGMNTWLYSIVYNVTGYGVEAALSVLVLLLLSANNFAKLSVLRKKVI